MFNTQNLEDKLLNISLTEDLGLPWRDATTELLFPTNHTIGHAAILSKHPEPIVICGIDWTQKLFNKLSNNCKIHTSFKDGDTLNPGQALLTIAAPVQVLLEGERVALNFLRHLCGIATLTRKYVDQVAHTPLKILDTRKTTPGLRILEKYAVKCGGGVNHRLGLYDAIMIKDTHVDLLGGMKNALARLPQLEAHGLPVVVEVRSLAELAVILANGTGKITRILLDNMTLQMMQECVAQCRDIWETEASGNIRLNTITAIAESGVDYASVGELTYNAGHVDLSMYTNINATEKNHDHFITTR